MCLGLFAFQAALNFGTATPMPADRVVTAVHQLREEKTSEVPNRPNKTKIRIFMIVALPPFDMPFDSVNSIAIKGGGKRQRGIGRVSRPFFMNYTGKKAEERRKCWCGKALSH